MKPSITTVLHSAGIYSSYQGYQYIIEAVHIAQKEPDSLSNIDKNIYTPISEMHKSSSVNVSKDIRTVRDVFMRNGGSEILYEISGSRVWLSNMPYPRELIALLSIYTAE